MRHWCGWLACLAFVACCGTRPSAAFAASSTPTAQTADPSPNIQAIAGAPASVRPGDPAVQFTQATHAVEKGAFSDALLLFERLSDQGFVHPDVSFNRALAYLQRAESTQRKPGDLGQAVAALREALLVADDPEAQRLVAATRQEISRRRAAQGLDPVIVAPPLGRAVSGLFSVSTWAVLALISSALLSLGLLVRGAAQTSAWRLAASIVCAVALGSLLMFGGLYALAYHYATSSREAVVVVDQATLRDANGKPLLTRALDTNSADVPEGATVYVLGRSGRLIQVQWGGSEAWLRDSEVRLLAHP